MIIGFTGKKQRGKNTAAEYLRDKFGYELIGFADKVKEYAYAIDPYIFVAVREVAAFVYIEGWYELVYNSLPSVDGSLIRLQKIVDLLGWEEAKKIADVRFTHQKTGTEGGRSIFDPLCPGGRVWIDLVDAQLRKREIFYLPHEQRKIALTDLRFDNEGQYIKFRQGLIIEVVSDRPGLPEVDTHSSENSFTMTPDLVLENNGTIEELHEKLSYLLGGYLKQK